jgi:glycerol-3-phosphate dehydrogenase (NAD(P)+)
MGNETHQPIAILGAGSWGTALALYLARQQQSVYLWTHEAAHASEMQATKTNQRFLPDQLFPDNLVVTSDLAYAIAKCEIILIVVPSAAFRSVLRKLKPLLPAKAKVCWATKGIDPETGELLHEVTRQILGEEHSYAILSGPSFAREVAAGLPTAIVAASLNPAFAAELIERFNSPSLRVYLSTDVTGVEIGGIVKNVLAIAAGFSDGMRLGSNARSALITRGLAEMIRLGLAAGGQYETFTGLAGLGDLILTCTDNQSRNHRFGEALGRGKSIAEAEQLIAQVIEGKRNAPLVIALAKKLGVEMPISETVWQVLQGKITSHEGLQNLLARAPKAE